MDILETSVLKLERLFFTEILILFFVFILKVD